MAEIQQISITVDAATLTALKQMDYALYALRAFATTNGAARPLVWFATTQYLENNLIDIQAEYQAYVSTTEVVDNAVITVTETAPVELGDLVTFNVAMTLTVAPGGVPGAVAVVSANSAPYTTGLMSAVNGQTPGAFSAAPLYGLTETIVAPADQVLLAFSTQGLQPGMVTTHVMSQSLLVDLTGATARAVTFDINTGWSAGGGTWATPVAAGADLTAILVRQKPMLRP